MHTSQRVREEKRRDVARGTALLATASNGALPSAHPHCVAVGEQLKGWRAD